MDNRSLVNELNAQLEFIQRFEPHQEMWAIAAGYLEDLWLEVLSRAMRGQIEL